MKNNIIIPMLAISSFFAASCSDWDDHFDEAGVKSTETVNVYGGDIISYMKNTADVSKISSLFQETGVYDNMSADKSYTFIVCDDNVYDANKIDNDSLFAMYCVADMALAPSLLKEGFGVQTRSNKNIWVYEKGNTICLDDYEIQKTVKTDNGYVYYVNGVMPVRQSIYEYLNSLGEDYSVFKQLIESYNDEWFDREHSTIIGVAQDGSTLYDSVKVTRNTLMDRYSEDGQATWNMRSEEYNSTMFIPTNAQIKKAIDDACDSIPIWLNRESTAADTAKFREWIVKACFVDRRLNTEEVSSSASDFKCVGGNIQVIDEKADKTIYESVDAAYWSPKAQRAETSNMVRLSNGNAYFLNSFKIPNHIVIYRVKSKFYDIWTSGKSYFTWRGWEGDPTAFIINDAQGSFYGSTQQMGTWPDILYNVLASHPSQNAIDNESTCSVEYTGIIKDANSENIYECYLPAGEYYLRMGFIHSLTYSLSIYFRDTEDIENNQYQTVAKDIAMSATASNFHFDRGGASDIPNYGETYNIGYPEGYNPAEWLETNENAYLYDTDGWPVGIVKIKKSGTFRIKVESKDASRIWALNGNTSTDKNNKNQLMMYHWCLRPTPNNY